jgi:hypothetical protein
MLPSAGAAPVTGPPQLRPLPFKGWNESVNSEGASLGMYCNDARSRYQRERPELPLPLGWIAVLDLTSRNIFYNHAASITSQWDEPLPLALEGKKKPRWRSLLCSRSCWLA